MSRNERTECRDHSLFDLGGPERSRLGSIPITDADSWNSPSKDIVEILRRVLDRQGKWQYVGPRLRLLNVRWKNAVDNSGCSLNLKRLRDLSLYHEAPELLRQKRVTSLNACPQEGRMFEWKSLGHLSDLISLQKLTLEIMHNGDAVLNGMLPLTPHLNALELDDVRMSQDSFHSIAQLHFLKKLILREVVFSNSGESCYYLLGGLTHLTSLAIEYCSDCADLQFLSELSKLESFTFATDLLQVSNMQCVSNLPNVTFLSLMTSTVREEDLNDFFFPTQLTTLKIDKYYLGKLGTTVMSGLKVLAFQSKMSCKLISLLNERQTSFYPILLPWQRRNVRSVVYHVQSTSLETSYMASLVSVDLANVSISPSILIFLAESVNLRELRLHMTVIAEIPAENSCVNSISSLNFPALQVLTMNPSHLLNRLVKKMVMPLLEHAGIWFDAEDSDLLVDALQSMHDFREISFGVNGMPDDENFWRGMHDVLTTNNSLKRIGWKQYESEPSEIPEFFTTSFVVRNILVDEDATVFMQSLEVR